MWLHGSAKIAGLLSPIVIGAASATELLLRGGLVMNSKSAAAAANLVSSELLSRASGLFHAVIPASEIALAFLSAIVLRQVNAVLAALELTFRAALAVIHVAGTLAHLAPLYLLQPV